MESRKVIARVYKSTKKEGQSKVTEVKRGKDEVY